MKKQLLLLMLLLIVNFPCLYSEDHTPYPFFKEGKEWLIRTSPGTSNYDPSWSSSAPFCYTITVCGDSVVDGITYKKLYYNRKILMGLFIEENGTPCVYTGNDVYCVQNQEYRPYVDWICYCSSRPCIPCPRHLPIYTDFSVTTGDTIYYMPTCEIEYQPCVVKSIDMRCNRKVFFLTSGDVIIEGIGSTQGLFPYEITDDIAWSRPWAPDPTGVSATLSDYGIKDDGDLRSNREEQLLRCTEDGVVIYEGGHLYDTPAGLSSESMGGDNDIDIICDEKGMLLLADRDLCGSVYRIHTLTGECVTTGSVDADHRIDHVWPNNELRVLTIETDKGIITKKVMR